MKRENRKSLVKTGKLICNQKQVGCVPPEEAPVWSGRCPLWTAGPSGTEQEHPGSGGERLGGWEHRRAATGRETAGW